MEYVALCVYCVAMAEKSDCLAEQVSGSSSTASKALSRSLLEVLKVPTLADISRK